MKRREFAPPKRRGFAPTNWIATQLVALLAVSSFVATGGAVLIHLLLLPNFELSTEGLRPVMRIATVLRGIDALPPEGRAQLLTAYDDAEFTAHLIDRADIPHLEPTFAAGRVRALFSREMPPGAEIAAIDPERDNQVRLYAISPGGQGVVFDVAPREHEPMHIAVVSLMVFLFVSTAVLTIWATRRLISPLKRFAAAVDRFGTDGHEGALREEGPVEIRRATSAFNRMQERIQHLIEDRTRMLVAISHDLRTPLTRLRLHIEELTAGVPRRQMLDEIALMDRLITSAISYIHEGGATETQEAADLPSLIETICDQFEDAGHSVKFEGPRHLTVRCLPLALGRALTNLIDNAVKFGTQVTVRLVETSATANAGTIAIDVEDNGPGIPDAEKALVLEPFYRTDTARRAADGFGLGLAIAATIAHHHAGTLTLHDRIPHGLRARLTIPKAGAPAPSTSSR